MARAYPKRLGWCIQLVAYMMFVVLIASLDDTVHTVQVFMLSDTEITGVML
jgi:hypothetical protein